METTGYISLCNCYAGLKSTSADDHGSDHVLNYCMTLWHMQFHSIKFNIALDMNPCQRWDTLHFLLCTSVTSKRTRAVDKVLL